MTQPPVFVEGCDFCAITSGADSTTEIVCSGESWLAFFPLEPATPGHTLIIPRTHVPNLWEADGDLAADLMGAAIRVGRAIDTALTPKGMNLISSAGTAAEQTVFHLHLHLVPRWPQDGFGPIWPTDKRHEDPSLDRVADRIREACGGRAAAEDR